MDEQGNAGKRQQSPVLAAVVVVLIGTIANFYFFNQYARPKTIGDGFEEVRGDMSFAKWSSTHYYAEIQPNALFAFVNGKLVGQFDFQSDAYSTLVSAGVVDNSQRFLIHVDQSKGTYSVNRYPEGDDDARTQPALTFVDTDGDGMTDRKIDWPNKRTYDATVPFTWSLLKPATTSSEP